MEMNEKQKPVIYLASVFLAILLVLHSPWTGYNDGSMSCDFCTANGTPDYLKAAFPVLPFWEWSSIHPVTPWFGSALNAMISFSLTIGLTALWCYLYRSPKKQ